MFYEIPMIANAGNDSLEHFHVNFSLNYRTESLDGEECLVVPMVMITNGVHAGSLGPVLYTPEELKKSESVWNHKPVVVYHPMRNGMHTSACTPEILANRRVGLILNTRYDKATGKLRAEAWLNKAKMEKVDKRILEAILANKMIEVSTGLWSDSIGEAGVFNGRDYKFKAANFRPDHLAILPDQVGACSIADGAGLLQVNSSFREMLDSISKAAREKWGDSVWVTDADSEMFVYEINDGLFALGYAMDGTDVTISSDSPIPISRQMRYVDSGSGVPILNMANFQFPSKGDDMNKQQMVNSLIANKSTEWTDGDRTWLMNQEESILKKMTANKDDKKKDDDEEKKTDNPVDMPRDDRKKSPSETGIPPQTSPEEKPHPEPAPKVPPVPGTDQTANMSVDQYIANSPPEFRDLFSDALATQRTQRDGLIGKIVANTANTFSREQLANMPTDQLRNIANLAERAAAQQPVPTSRQTNWAAASTPAPVANTAYTPGMASKDDPDYLPRPSMSFTN